jgi:hypothetical protein
MADKPIFPGSVKTPVAQIQNSDGTNAVTLMTAGASGAKLEGISATSTDTSAVVVQLIASISAVDYVLGEVTIPSGSGTNGTDKAVKVLNSTDLPWINNDGVNDYLLLGSGVIIKIKPKTTVTAGKALQFLAQGGDF